MLSKQSIQKIASLLKLDAAKFEEILTAQEEKEVSIDDKLQVFDDASLQARDRNKYNEGKTAGQEMLVKDMKRKHNIEVEGDDPDKFIEAFANKVKKETGGNVDDRVKDLETKIEHFKNQSKKAEERASQLEKQMADAAFDRELLTYFPKNRDSKFTDDEYLTLVKKSISIVEKDGKKVVVRDGKEARAEKDLEPIGLKDVVESYFGERKWVEEAGAGGGGQRGGAGGKDSTPGGGGGKFQKLSDVTKHLEAEGISAKSEKGQAFLAAVVKENPDLDMRG